MIENKNRADNRVYRLTTPIAGKSDFAHKTLFRFISHKILPRVKARIFYLYLKAYRMRVPPSAPVHI